MTDYEYRALWQPTEPDPLTTQPITPLAVDHFRERGWVIERRPVAPWESAPADG
jgi:hypothetical protein